MIEAIGLTKRYGDYEAVKDVSFKVGSGKIVGLLGPNGAGKTTIMRMLTGYHWPTEGCAKLDGFDVVKNPIVVKQRVGYLPENAPLYSDLSVSEFLKFVSESRNIDKSSDMDLIDNSVQICNLGSVYNVPIEKLSKGFRQRVGLAQAILHDPDILILDEPTSGLDPNQILEIRALIRSLGQKKTVILSTHILQEAEALCTEVLIMNEGRIVASGPTDRIGETLKGEENFDLILKGDTSGLRNTLKNLENLKLTGDPENIGQNLIKIRLASNIQQGADSKNMAENVFDWAISSGYKILEMRRERL